MPCKPRMRGCRSQCLHRQLVEAYRDARDAWEVQLEAESLEYPREAEDFRLEHPPPTFKGWLTGNSGQAGQPSR